MSCSSIYDHSVPVFWYQANIQCHKAKIILNRFLVVVEKDIHIMDNCGELGVTKRIN